MAWSEELDSAPTSYLVASGDLLTFATASGHVTALATADGRWLQQVEVGEGLQAPALFRDTLVVAARNRVGAYDLSARTWRWRLRDQETTGRVLAPPVVVGEGVWIASEESGLVAVGMREAGRAGTGGDR
jgi:hypothetical protein